MRYLFGFLCVCALGLMPLVGCETADEGGSGGTAGGGGSAGGGGGGTAGGGGTGGSANTATLTTIAREVGPEGSEIPLEGVRFCETSTSNCQVTGPNGNATLQLPADREIIYTHEKGGYSSNLRADVLPASTSLVVTLMRTDAQTEALYENLMSPYPMEGTGAIYVSVASDPWLVDPIAGATLDLLGTEGKAYYVDEEGNWSLSLAATTSAGVGGFVDVSPGVFEVKVGGTAKNCLLVRGWPSDSENTIRLPVREGFRTIARVDCD